MARYKVLCFNNKTAEIFGEVIFTKNITDEKAFEDCMSLNINLFKKFLLSDPHAQLHIIPVVQPQVELPLFNQKSFY